MLLDLINKRRSVRHYLNRPIPKEDLMKCLEAARLAPSACNAQPWKFIVIDDPGLKNNLCDAAFGGIYSMNSFVKNAAALVVVISEKKKFLTAMGGYLRNTRYYLIDIGIACEHLILQASELGIGTCWIGWFNEKSVKKVLDIPRQKRVEVIISLGYPQEGQSRPREREPLSEIALFNKATPAKNLLDIP